MTPEVSTVRRAPTSRDDDFDPITFSVILSRFESIAHEMTLTLEHTAWTSILALARDYSCAIYDAEPRQICMFDAIPIHTTSMHLVLQEIVDAFEGDINDGDIFLCNDPYRGNTHVGDVVTAVPVFHEGELLFWSVTKGHQMDIGAAVPSSVVSSAKDVFEEGLHIPPVRIYDRGVPRKDIIDLYLSNVRYRDLLRGDLLAQLGSIGKGKSRLQELAAEFGVEETRRYVDAIIEYADRRMSEEIRAMPDGVYVGESWVDSDGVGQDHVNIPVKVTVEIRDDQVYCDLAGTAPQVPSGINASYAISQAAPLIPFLYYVDPAMPHNHGCFRHLHVDSQPGTVAHAQYPASTSCATVIVADALQDAVNKALVHAIPERVIAGGPHGANIPQFTGTDSRTGKDWGVMLFNNGGGSGATAAADGWPLISTIGAWGGLKSLVIEQIELLYPILIEEMTIEPDSMGFGTSIGGPGTRLSVRPLHGSLECITFGDGCANPPHGVLGGTPGIGGGQFVEGVDGGARRFMSAGAYFGIGANERRIGVSSGGGGYGPPEERPAEQVLRDVRDGYITPGAAAEHFGVILTGEGLSLSIDEKATAARRAELAQRTREPVTPTAPGAATWLQEQMRDDDAYFSNPVLTA